MKSAYGSQGLQTEPASVPSRPGVEHDDITFRVALDGGRQLEVVALLVANVRTAPASFTRRTAAAARGRSL